MLKLQLSWQSIAALFLIWIVYHLFVALYRITFHPLTAFPGPKLAALSYKYEFYFDGILGGQYTAEIARMHEKYGPIVRINPEELHCNDPHFADQIYPSGGEKRDKSPYYLGQFGAAVGLSAFGAVHHNLHRIRRGAISRFFSKASITKIEPLIQDLAQRLCNRLLARSKDGRPAFDISMAYSCFTTDVITRYCFGQSHGYLDQEDFEPNLVRAIRAGVGASAFVKQWPFLFNIADSIPDAVAGFLSADLKVFIVYQAGLRKDVKRMKAAHTGGKRDAIEEEKSIFGELFRSNLPEEEKSMDRLGAESSALIGAGTDTTKWTLSIATYYLNTQPETYERLVQELRTVVTDPDSLPSWAALESGVILESLRLSYGLSTRIARVSPEKDLFYKGNAHEYIIPKGTPIGMTSVIIHTNESIFPRAAEFIPERWLREDGTRKIELEKYLLSFSKGSRVCVGMNLAYCELYIALAALVLKVFPHLKLFETTVDDVKYHHDMIIPMTRPESLGVRVLIE